MVDLEKYQAFDLVYKEQNIKFEIISKKTFIVKYKY